LLALNAAADRVLWMMKAVDDITVATHDFSPDNSGSKMPRHAPFFISPGGVVYYFEPRATSDDYSTQQCAHCATARITATRLSPDGVKA
jgi:hypothetical protein